MRNPYSSDALLSAIRAKCMECCGNQRREVERCKLNSCPLHPYRSCKVVSVGHERRAEINGQIGVFDILRLEERAI